MFLIFSSGLTSGDGGDFRLWTPVFQRCRWSSKYRLMTTTHLCTVLAVHKIIHHRLGEMPYTILMTSHSRLALWSTTVMWVSKTPFSASKVWTILMRRWQWMSPYFYRFRQMQRPRLQLLRILNQIVIWPQHKKHPRVAYIVGFESGLFCLS